MAATRVAGTTGRAKTAAPISMCDGVFMASAYRDRHGFSSSAIGGGARRGIAPFRTVRPITRPGVPTNPNMIGKCPRPVEVCLHFRRGHVAGQPIDIETDVGRHAKDRGLFGNQRRSHEATAKLLLLALPCSRDRSARGKLGGRPEDRKFMLNQPEGGGILGQQACRDPAPAHGSRGNGTR
jgi:hypothetical protein